MPPEPESRTLYHPENPAAIIPRSENSSLPPQYAGGTGRFIWGMAGNAMSFLLAIVSPFSLVFILLVIPLGMAFAMMGVMYGSGLIAEGRAVKGATAAIQYGHICRIVGYVALVIHILCAAAWVTTVMIGIPPILNF